LSLILLAGFALGVGCSSEAPVAPAPATANPAPAEAPLAPEGTDVWLMELVRDNATLRAVQPRNLTNRPGYDNQPHFTPAGDIMFVQMEDGRTDIWRWSARTEQSTRLTDTPLQGEFSPTPIPQSDGGISYIRSPDDTSGRLWRMPSEGAPAEIIFADIGPVGYHAWFDTQYVALWRLQEPSLLQVVEVTTQESRTIATDVGRSPQSVPQRRAVSFTITSPAGTSVAVYDLDQDRTEILAQLPEGGEFHAWTPDGVLLCSSGSRVLAWVDGNWQEVADLAQLNLTLSRLAVSPSGNRLAVVAEPAP
jgi:hypothetical protein